MDRPSESGLNGSGASWTFDRVLQSNSRQTVGAISSPTGERFPNPAKEAESMLAINTIEGEPAK
jgi:hypothetical protein